MKKKNLKLETRNSKRLVTTKTRTPPRAPRRTKNNAPRKTAEGKPMGASAPLGGVGEALHPAEQYAADVMSGKIVVGKWVRLAVQRHVRDLATAAKRGLMFDRVRAERAIRFFKFLKHTKGEWAGQTFVPDPWQQFILWCVFGWRKVNADGTPGPRRFRMAYVKVARKNGKSTLAAGVGLELFFADGEPGADVYTCATKRDQARIVHGEAIAMVNKSPELSRYINAFKDNLHVVATRSKFEPLGADEDTTDGLNVHGAIVDELHAHKNRGMLDVLDSATGARRQPLIFIITTAGAGRVGVDQDMQGYAEKILEGIIEEDSFFAIIYAIDEKDDWRDEKCWIKANPGMGVSVKIDDLRAKCRKAIEMPSALNEFLCKHMNRQTEQLTRWLSMEKWNACAAKISEDLLIGRRCYIGLDLSSKLDVTAMALVFPPFELDARWRFKLKMFVPEETSEQREREARVPYATWGRQGFLELTPGNVVDYDYVRRAIFDAARTYELVEVGYDAWNATQIALQLQEEGVAVVEVNQGYRTLSEPTKELERLLAAGQMGHEGNPVLDWMASNVSIETDPTGSIKPSKRRSQEKIDGISAMVTGMARAILSGGGSAYDDGNGGGRDLLVL